MNKKILVTGAGGYIGIPLCKEIVKNGFEVIALDRFFFGEKKLRDAIKNNRWRVLKGDIRYFDTKILKGIDIVIDLAGLSNDACGDLDVKLTEKINYKGAVRVIKAAKKYGVKRYIYSSSASVYGSNEKLGLTEKEKLNPLTTYAKSKALVEKELLDLNSKNFETVILRNSTVFGVSPRMRFDLAINVMTMRAWRDKVIYIMGGGKQWRPFIHLSDLVRFFILMIKEDRGKVAGEIFNVGGNEMNFQIEKIARFVTEEIENVKIHRIPDNRDKRSYNLNFDKIKKRFGFEPKMGISNGVREIKKALEQNIIKHDDPTGVTVLWYKSLMEWEKKIRQVSYKGRIL